MSERKAKPLRVEFGTCLTLMACGLSMHRQFLSPSLWKCLTPFLIIVAGVLCVAALVMDFMKGTEEEVEREERDERNLMIQDRASWFCWRVENVLLIVAWMGFTLFSEYYVLYYALYWILLLRYWLFFLTRWWMNRKY